MASSDVGAEAAASESGLDQSEACNVSNDGGEERTDQVMERPMAETFDDTPAASERLTTSEEEDKKAAGGQTGQAVAWAAMAEEEEEEESARERLRRHRAEMAGRVWVPETWGQERLLKEWADCAAFDRSLVPREVVTAREALVAECVRRTSS